MIKILSILLLASCSLFLAPSAHASYPQTYSDYQYQYSQYRAAYQNYQIAKSAHLTYKTLVTQNDALEKMRLVLLARTGVVNTYLTLIWEKMAITEGLDPSSKDTFIGISQKEQAWLADNQKKIVAASTIADLNTISSDFASRYSQIKSESNLAITQILTAKTDFAYSKIGNFFPQVSQIISQMDSLGENTVFYKRGLTTAQAKADLYLDKKEAVKKEIAENRDFDLLKIQKNLQEGLEYIKEATSYLKEILNGITQV